MISIGPGGAMQAPAAELKPCRSPYCECDAGQCTHPGFYDARDEVRDQVIIPDGMVRVTKGEFFSRLSEDRRDIMPNIDAPNHTWWRVVDTRDVWGWSAPGWRNPGAHPKVFAIFKKVTR